MVLSAPPFTISCWVNATWSLIFSVLAGVGKDKRGRLVEWLEEA